MGMKKRHLTLFFLSLLFMTSCGREETPFISKKPDQIGITFQNRLTQTQEWNILRYLYFYNGGGIAAGDFNNDGKIDLYFSGNQVDDRLYLNKGKWRFEDITEGSGIDNKGDWTTGVTHVDINGDGLLDIYVCRVSGAPGNNGHNLLYVNQGLDRNGIPRFAEQAGAYGLDFEGYSTHAAFFDKDRDGDLDLYLLNHSIHPNRTYGKGSQRSSFHPEYGDVLFECQDGRYVEVSEEAGIYQGKSGYGLGISAGYFDRDSLPDLYIGNDFYENDYCYINLDGSRFRELLSEGDQFFGHTTHFSMGNTVADLNRDGREDILSLDMLPRDRETYMTSGQEYPYSTYRNYLRSGYHPQYMQNTLNLNLGGLQFAEAGFLADIAATDWSWSVLTPDLDNDGWKDVFITNGILGATNDMDFINFISAKEMQKKIVSTSLEDHMDLIRAIPEKKVANLVYRNPGRFPFENKTGEWMKPEKGFSQGGIYADLDNDGDLDLVSSSTNGPVEIWENRLPARNWVSLEFKGHERNSKGVGARATLYYADSVQTASLFPSNAYLSSLSNRLHFGLGSHTRLDSVAIDWPWDGRQVFYDVQTGRHQILSYDPKAIRSYPTRPGIGESYRITPMDSLVDFVHSDPPTLDFDRSPLIPYGLSNEGPDLASGDLNGDGRIDLVICGGKGQQTAVLIQTSDGKWEKQDDWLSEHPAINEDVAVEIADFNSDGLPDLAIASAGNEFRLGEAIAPRLYLNTGNTLEFKEGAVGPIEIQASDLSVADYDGDGDADLLITGLAKAREFGEGERSFLLNNNGQAEFTDVTSGMAEELTVERMITDSDWADLDGNGYPDIVLSVHWGKPLILWNDGEKFSKQADHARHPGSGLWNAVHCTDLDGDGDLDVLLGNWGLNSKLRASGEQPLRLYKLDFDNNGTEEVLVTHYVEAKETPLISKEIWSKQLPAINKRFLSYADFARADLSDIFGKEQLQQARQEEVTELRSGYLINLGDGRLEFHPLPDLAQLGSIEAFTVTDMDGDPRKEVIATGNRYELSTQIGRLDGMVGLVMEVPLASEEWKIRPLGTRIGAARSMEGLPTENGTLIVIGINNGPLRVLKMGKE